MGLNPSTVATLQTDVFNTFPRTSPNVVAKFTSDLEQWINELCHIFPYWFLVVQPGKALWADFPLDPGATPDVAFATLTPLAGQWVDRGWLLATPGVPTYTFYHPTVDEQSANPAYWVTNKCQKVNYVKEFDQHGCFRRDIDQLDYDYGLSRSRIGNNCEWHRHPLFYTWESTESQSTISFQPTPQDYHLYAVEFILERLPMYTPPSPNTDTFNRFLTFYPNVVTYYCLYKLAEFFIEPELATWYKEQLYGPPVRTPMNQTLVPQGLIGDLIRDTERRVRQKTGQLTPFKSLKAAVGRNRTGHRYDPYSPYGWYPTP